MTEPTDFEFELMDIKEAGAQAYRDGFDHADNPYPAPISIYDPESRRSHAWFDGWSDEQIKASEA